MDPFEVDCSEEAHVTLVSNAARAHPENTLFNFTNSLAIPLQVGLGDEWEVALQSISVSNALGYDFKEDAEEERKISERLDRLTEAPSYPLEEDDVENTSAEFLIGQYWHSEEAMEKIKEALVRFVKNRDRIRKRFFTQQKELDERLEALTTYAPLTKLEQNAVDAFTLTRARRDRLNRLVAKLQTVYVAYTLNKHLTSYSPVYLELEEVSTEWLSGKEIAQFNLNADSDSVFVNYTPRIKCFFPLKNRYLPKLSARIKDGRGNTLSGKAGNPTVINLTLRKKRRRNAMNREEYEYRTCYVQSEPGQSPVNFYADLPSFLTEYGVSTAWEMALVKSSVPHRILHLPGKYRIEVVERFQERPERMLHHMDLEVVQDLIRKSREDSRYYFKSHEFEFEHNPSINDLIELLSSVLGEADQQNNPTAVNARQYSKFYRFKARKQTSRVKITGNRRLVVIMPNPLAACLGFQNQVIVLDDHNCCLELRDKADRVDGEKVPDISPDNIISDLEELKKHEERYAIRAQFPADTDLLTPQNLLLYTDCITSSLVGNSYGQYLTNIPLSRSNNSFFSEFACLHPEYHKLNTNALDRVNFKLLETAGTVPVFQYANTSQIISNYQSIFTLSFRRKIN